MGLATIDPHSHKVLTSLNKISKVGVNRPNIKQEYCHLKMSKFSEKYMAIRTPSEHSVRFDFLKWLYLTVKTS